MKTIYNILVEKVKSYHTKKTFIFLSSKGGELQELNYLQLAQKAIALGSLMSNRGWSRKRVMLLYSESYAFEEIFVFRPAENFDRGIETRQLIAELGSEQSDEHLSRYLEAVFASKSLSFNIDESRHMRLSEIGIDSLKAMEIVKAINKDLQINLDITIIYENNTVSGLLNAIGTRLWLNRDLKGEEIIL